MFIIQFYRQVNVLSLDKYSAVYNKAIANQVLGRKTI